MGFAEKFKELRKKHHYTQKDIANILDVKPTTISAWELGNNSPRMDMLQKISDVFSVDTGYFFDEKSNQTVDLDDDVIFTYEGRKIPKRDLQIIKNMIEAMKKEDD